MSMCGHYWLKVNVYRKSINRMLFSDVQSAHACMEQGDHIGKIVLEMNA